MRRILAVAFNKISLTGNSQTKKSNGHQRLLFDRIVRNSNSGSWPELAQAGIIWLRLQDNVNPFGKIVCQMRGDFTVRADRGRHFFSRNQKWRTEALY
jgi:hypothetical protein